MLRSRLTALAAAVAVVALAGGGVAYAAPRNQHTPPPGHHHHRRHERTYRICGQDQQLTVHGLHKQVLLVRNDYWHGQRPECLVNHGRHANFRVARPAGHSSVVVAYPYIFIGCAWNACTRGSHLPARVSSLRNPRVSWITSQHAGGRWNAALDTWYGKHPMRSGQADGAEIMVWLNTHNLPSCAGWPHFRLDGREWCVEHWRANHGGRVSWNYVQFRLLSRHWAIKLLRLKPLLRYAERKGWLKPKWYLENVEAGFEIWRGGKGLATRWYSPRF